MTEPFERMALAGTRPVADAIECAMEAVGNGIQALIFIIVVIICLPFWALGWALYRLGLWE